MRREQSRWVTIESFDVIPFQLRVDQVWLNHLTTVALAEVVFELQPVLTRVEVEQVLRAIAASLKNAEKLTGTGSDFSGRRWLRGLASRESIERIARDFFSVQSIHSPLYSVAAGKSPLSRAPATGPAPPAQLDSTALPCVAILDLGVPSDHRRLRPFKRGQFVPIGAPRAPIGNHGSYVASRIVFGDCATPDALLESPGTCSFYDGMVGVHPGVTRRRGRGEVDDKLVMETMAGIAGAAPDVRVFNLSFGYDSPLSSFSEVERNEHKVNLRDLDNFVFANDSIVVVAAGNSVPGSVPNPEYPEHHNDARWALGPWTCGFNTLVCGSFVSRLSASGLVTEIGWPSPFCRVGPGLCEAPIPSFSAEGGNTDESYGYAPELGVWCFSGAALPEDKIGTSFAAPLLAREAALTLDRLQQHCAPGTRPFAVTARAFLTLTATPPPHVDAISELIERTLGYGKAQCARLLSPTAGSAVILWQGYMESTKDIVRVQLPIPLVWLTVADDPALRLVVCYDPPVNEAASGLWACRRVSAKLKMRPDDDALRSPRGSHNTYPVIHRIYKLARYKSGAKLQAEGNMWLLELAYEEIAAYPPGLDFASQQRVAFAAELVDFGQSQADPQPAMQALPIAHLMNRLSIQPVPVRNPIIIARR